jgi:hypothetical protein
MIVSFAICLTIGYAFGRYATPRQPFYLLGTPIDPVTNSNQRRDASAQGNANRPPLPDSQTSASSTDLALKLCGAPTKSGRPCRRKVTGSGYCWQHRDKYAPKKR